ncbi:MAG: hypothetical protein IJ190_03360 [Prevotella sp.]|nr:hypothetical protein [Prevotella sp.]
MKKNVFVAFSLLAVMGFWACEESFEDNPVEPQESLRVYAASGCKFHARPDGTRGPSHEQCVEYKALADGYLSLNHVNVGFNCDPGQIITNVYINGDTIEVVEREERSGADCVCFYDLYSEVGPLEDKSYTIVFERGRWRYEKFRFNIQYSPSLSGTYNVKEEE